MAMSAHSNRRSRIVGSTAVALVALVAALFGAAAPAGAVPSDPVARYVALGDSYAAGQGAGIPLDDCLRSTAAYPVLLDAEPRTNLLRQASCSGATVDGVLQTQLSQVNRGTTLVTLTAGANDLGAGDVYATCAMDPASLDCALAIGTVQQLLLSGAIGQDITELIGAIAERAPNAHIVVTDYPVPFVPGLPSPGGITDIVNAATGSLNDQIAAGVLGAFAAGADVELASVEFAFAGHQAGDPDPWLGSDPADPLTFLHPTSDGQEVYRDAVRAALAS